MNWSRLYHQVYMHMIGENLQIYRFYIAGECINKTPSLLHDLIILYVEQNPTHRCVLPSAMKQFFKKMVSHTLGGWYDLPSLENHFFCVCSIHIYKEVD